MIGQTRSSRAVLRRRASRIGSTRSSQRKRAAAANRANRAVRPRVAREERVRKEIKVQRGVRVAKGAKEAKVPGRRAKASASLVERAARRKVASPQKNDN